MRLGVAEAVEVVTVLVPMVGRPPDSDFLWLLPEQGGARLCFGLAEIGAKEERKKSWKGDRR